METEGIEGTGTGAEGGQPPSNGGQELDFAQKFSQLTHRENQLRQQEKQYKEAGSDLESFNRIKSGSWRNSDEDRNALLQTLGVSDYTELGQYFGKGTPQGEQNQQSSQSSDPVLQKLMAKFEAQEERERQEEIKTQRSQLRQTIDNHEGEDFAGLKGLEKIGSYDMVGDFIDRFKKENGYDIDPMEAAKAVSNQYKDTFTQMLENPYLAKLASERLGKRQEAPNRDSRENSHNTISNNMSARPPTQDPHNWLEDDDASKARMADKLGWT